MTERPFRPAEDLWWALVTTYLRADLPDGVKLDFDDEHHVMSLEVDGARLHMQRIRGDRAVMWSRVTFPASPDADLLDGAPDWVGSEVVRTADGDDSPEFIAWYSHGEWDSNDLGWWHANRDRFAILRTTHRGTIGEAMRGELDHPVAVAARGAAPVNSQAGVRRRLARSVYDQMREAPEVDRGHPHQPMALVNWLRVARPHPFVALARVEHGVVRVVRSPRLPDVPTERLTAVLQQLHRDEAADDSGAWLMARVAYDGRRITLQRAFDSLPRWYDAEPPALDALTWEMRQRVPRWRPAWVRLLPERVDDGTA